MTAVREVHAQDGVAGLCQRKIDGHVRLRARMGLYVCVLRAEELFCAVDCELFRHVHILAAAVIALAGISLRVFVRERRAHGRHYGLRDKVLACNQLNIPALAGELVHHGGGHFRVERLQVLQILQHETHSLAYKNY